MNVSMHVARCTFPATTIDLEEKKMIRNIYQLRYAKRTFDEKKRNPIYEHFMKINYFEDSALY